MIITKKKILVNPLECFTKSEYARKIKVSPTYIATLIEKKKLTEVKIQGGSFVIVNP